MMMRRKATARTDPMRICVLYGRAHSQFLRHVVQMLLRVIWSGFDIAAWRWPAEPLGQLLLHILLPAEAAEQLHCGKGRQACDQAGIHKSTDGDAHVRIDV